MSRMDQKQQQAHRSKDEVLDLFNLLEELQNPTTTMAQRNECAGLLKETIEQHLELARLTTELAQGHGLLVGDRWLHEANPSTAISQLRLVQS